MLTGINFSPPLYFLFNFCLQLIFPTSIEQLRIQSLAFIIIGIILSFLLTRKIFGTTIAFLSTILVASQSNLLLSQAQEARHYAMFFACGTWVLFMQSFDGKVSKINKCLTFLAHFCLCQVHYLGIIFSGLVGIAYFFTSNNKVLWQRIPTSIILCWLVSIVSYFFYLTRQKSVLNTWPKPNGLPNLLASYNDTLLILTTLIPFLALIISSNSKGNTETLPKEEIDCSRPIMFTSFLWIFVPLLFWIISNITPLNLFVDRYFVPKETAVIFLVGFGLSFIFQNLPSQKTMSIPFLGTFGFSLVLLLVTTKRGAFGLDKNINYHHSLIIEKTLPKSKHPIIVKEDPIYFPNAYKNRNEFLFLVKEKEFKEIYIQFSKKLNIWGV